MCIYQEIANLGIMDVYYVVANVINIYLSGQLI